MIITDALTVISSTIVQTWNETDAFFFFVLFSLCLYNTLLKTKHFFFLKGDFLLFPPFLL